MRLLQDTIICSFLILILNLRISFRPIISTYFGGERFSLVNFSVFGVQTICSFFTFLMHQKIEKNKSSTFSLSIEVKQQSATTSEENTFANGTQIAFNQITLFHQMQLKSRFAVGSKRSFDLSGEASTTQQNRNKALKNSDSAKKFSHRTAISKTANSKFSLPPHQLNQLLKHNQHKTLKEAMMNSHIEQNSSSEEISVQPLHTTNAVTSTTTNMRIRSSSDCSSSSSICSDESVSSWSSIEASATSTIKSPENLEPTKLMQNLNKLNPKGFSSTTSPDIYVGLLFTAMLSFEPTARPTLELSSLPYNNSNDPFIPPITEEELSNYDVEVVTATRDEDLDALRSLHSNGRPLSCCNRYGESLMHMACRRGFFSIVKFLLEEANVAVRITDDCGRTPMHDALWHKDCQYETVDLLLSVDPSMLLLSDKRGHTPFAYARKEHWEVWKQFLWDRREHIMRALDRDVMELFRLKI